MAYARIVTRKKETIIRTIHIYGAKSTKYVDRIAGVLEGIIREEEDILKVEVDYTGCDDTALE